MSADDTVARVAGSLTETMRETLVQKLRYKHGESILQYGLSTTLRALERRGLVDGACLTPLGLALRAYLEERG